MSVREFQSRIQINLSNYWHLRFGMPIGRHHHYLSNAMMRQLKQCKDDESRRLLLGVSR